MEQDIMELREYLFKQEKQEFIQGAITILEKMGKDINKLSPIDVGYYEKNVKNIGLYLNCEDYLAIADIMKYELLPLFLK